MVQQIITYVLVVLATFYVVNRSYETLRKQKACGKCELMKLTKLPKNTTS